MTGIQQLIVERYAPMLEKGMGDIITYGKDLFTRAVEYNLAQSYVLLFIGTLLTIVCPIVMVILYKKIKKIELENKTKRSYEKEDTDGYVGIFFVCLFTLVLGATLLGVSIYQLLQLHYIPEIYIYNTLTK